MYFSYEDNVEKLKAIELDYLTADVDVIYKSFYELALEIFDFIIENEDLVDELFDVSSSVDDCLTDNLSEAEEHHKNVTIELSQNLDESPKTPTCYKDLQIYFNDIKEESKKRLQNNETSEKAVSYIRDVFNKDIVELEEVVSTYLMDYDEDLDEMMDDYIEDMVAAKEEKKSKTEIEELSAKYVSELKEMLVEYIEDLKKDGFLNKETLEHALEEYKKIMDSCQQMERDLSSDTAMMQSFTLTDIANIERYSTAKVYILDSENSKLKISLIQTIYIIMYKILSQVKKEYILSI